VHRGVGSSAVSAAAPLLNRRYSFRIEASSSGLSVLARIRGAMICPRSVTCGSPSRFPTSWGATAWISLAEKGVSSAARRASTMEPRCSHPAASRCQVVRPLIPGELRHGTHRRVGLRGHGHERQADRNAGCHPAIPPPNPRLP
jgi:hypothetical protein